jgi:hypothetical protein
MASPSLSPPTPATDHPVCPRCDYDLSGAASRESDAVGVCPECGLCFHWRDVLTTLATPSWALEPLPHPTWADLALRAPKVAARALAPWFAWRRRDGAPNTADDRLTMAHAITTHGLLRTTLAGFAVSWLLAASLSLLLALLLAGFTNEINHVIARTNASDRSVPFLDQPNPWRPDLLWNHVVQWRSTPILAPGVAWTADSAETVRAMVLSFWPLGATLLMPITMLLLGRTMARREVRLRHLLRLAAYAVIPLPILGFLVAIPSYLVTLSSALAVLRNTSQRAHEYSVPGTEWAMRGSDSARRWFIETFAGFTDHVVRDWGVPIVGVLVLAWLWTWWSTALTRYLRLPAAAFDTFLLLIVGVLATPLAALLIISALRLTG